MVMKQTALLMKIGDKSCEGEGWWSWAEREMRSPGVEVSMGSATHLRVVFVAWREPLQP
jgi:hypothetical protein